MVVRGVFDFARRVLRGDAPRVGLGRCHEVVARSGQVEAVRQFWSRDAVREGHRGDRRQTARIIRAAID